MQFLVHIAKKLASLHAAGWVHRDLKPGASLACFLLFPYVPARAMSVEAGQLQML